MPALRRCAVDEAASEAVAAAAEDVLSAVKGVAGPYMRSQLVEGGLILGVEDVGSVEGVPTGMEEVSRTFSRRDKNDALLINSSLSSSLSSSSLQSTLAVEEAESESYTASSSTPLGETEGSLYRSYTTCTAEPSSSSSSDEHAKSTLMFSGSKPEDAKLSLGAKDASFLDLVSILSGLPRAIAELGLPCG